MEGRGYSVRESLVLQTLGDVGDGQQSSPDFLSLQKNQRSK